MKSSAPVNWRAISRAAEIIERDAEEAGFLVIAQFFALCTFTGASGQEFALPTGPLRYTFTRAAMDAMEGVGPPAVTFLVRYSAMDDPVQVAEHAERERARAQEVRELEDGKQ